VIVRTAALYLAGFVCVLIALSAGAYAFMAREYAALMGPALGTPEATAGIASAMQHVIATIVAIDLPIVVLVAIASYVLARAAIAPIDAARERERIFASDAAHELRTPLTAISTVAQAARANASLESRAAFEEIARTALDAAEIVGGLLTLARDPRPGVLQCEPIDLAAVVATCARELNPGAAERGIALEVETGSAIVDGDERRLRELLRNLVENALRYARTTVRIASERSGRGCELIVEDDGAGIPETERERVFDRFYRRENDGAGTGLGLAIVRWIALAHRGVVTASQSPLGGARFVATLPQHRDA
jgi:signal transduction histidine kinase